MFDITALMTTTALAKRILDKKDANALIAVSNDLLNKAQWPRLSINEQRLILYILALVEKKDEDFKRYRISIQELKNAIGTKTKNAYTRFDEATDALMGKIIRWLDPEYEDLIKVTWCCYARLSPGRGFVELEFHPELKPFLLALKGNFTMYELRAVIRLQSHYSLRIYQFLKFNQGIAKRDGRRSATVSVEWMKQYLDISSDQYKQYGHFKSKVLKLARKDIEEKTDLLFHFVEHKESRKVTHLEFFWSKNPAYEQQELPFKPPVEHQPQPPQAPSQHKELPLPADGISSRLQELGFDDWRKIRNRLSDKDWKIAFADLDFEIQRKARSGQHLSNPGGWLRSRIRLSRDGEPYNPSNFYQANRQREQDKKERSAREKKERRNAAKIGRLKEIFEKERDSKLKELISNYTSDQKKAFKTWVENNFPESDFVKPYETDGEPKISYLKLYFIDTVIPEYNDFTRWAEEKKDITIEEESAGGRVTG